MKKAKKMALQAMVCAAFVAAMVLAGCTTEEGGDSDIINANGRSATIECSNDTGDILRGFKTIKYGHSYATCDIEMENVSAAGTSAMGLVFGCVSGDVGNEKLYSFYRIAVKNKATEGNKTYGPCFYVDYVKNQPVSEISKGNGEKYSTDVSGYKEFTKSPVTAQKLFVKITVEETSTGTLVVTCYDKDGVQIGHFAETTSHAGWTKKTEGDVGYYATVVNDSTLKGSWKIIETQNAEIAEAE